MERPAPPQPTRDAIRVAAGIAFAGAAAAAIAGIAGCAELRGQARRLTGPDAARFGPAPRGDRASAAVLALNRAAFGPRPGDVARVAAMGAPAYLEEQLGDQFGEDPAVPWRVNALDVQQDEQDAPDVLSSLGDDQLAIETQQAALLRSVYSRHQLREVMADFWTNHFNIYALKNDGRVLIPTDAERVIRPHVVGKFRDLLVASAHSPAMLAYLDNQQNRRGVANENYARELMELHTLGVRSGYSQPDIQEVARCFTGWTVTGGLNPGRFDYDASRHDDGAKYVPFLGLRIAPGGGQRDAETVLERLAVHPATARFLARKLCRRILGHAPDTAVQRAASAYLRADTDIRAMLRPILLDALPAPGGTAASFKRPLDLVVSALRAFAADSDCGAELQRHLAEMGQPLYQWPMPDGFPDRAAAWTGSLLPRWNFALALAASAIDGTTIDLDAPLSAVSAHTSAARVDALIEAATGRPAEDPGLQSLRKVMRGHAGHAAGTPVQIVNSELAGLILASPAFQWKA